uniref:TIR domain-containing protein n=1 Tax=Adineta steineri TaxID=433720 RepID=A0A819WDA6_9BILA|nr:unnamed protein product [Adineta steineri]
MSSHIIDQLCDEFQKKTVTIDQVKTFCDDIYLQLNQNKDQNNINFITPVVNIFQSLKKEQINDSRILDHSLFIILRDVLISLLDIHRNKLPMDKLAKNISSLFNTMIFKFVNNNVEIFKRLLLHKPLIDQFSEYINKCVDNLLDISDESVEVLNNLLSAYENLIRKRTDIQDNPLMTILFETVVKCFSSHYYEKMLNDIGKQTEMNIREELFFERCPYFIYQCRSQHRRYLLNDCRKILLPLFNKQLPFNQVNKPVIATIGSICALIFVRAYVMMNNNTFYDQYEKLLTHLLQMLHNTNQNDSTNIQLIKELVEQLANFISFEQYFGKMRELKASSLFLSIIDNTQDEYTHFQIYRILAAILTEKDIKTLALPDKIVRIFLGKINDIINNIHSEEPLDNILIALKSLVQHDQIKAEIVKQQGLPLLIRCATEPELIKQAEGTQLSLEILLALTFNTEAFNYIKNNSLFLEELKKVRMSTDDDGKRFAEGIFWKLEEEKKPIQVIPSPSHDQYDIMISYCHRNKDLCHDIYDRLVNDGFRVWLDRENMFGSPMDAMAHAIENSQYVLVCMSDAYKQSPCCQLEANYAFQRKCPMIPLVVTPRYRPDGWLGIITSGKIYIDIPKLTMDTAYVNLKNEIDAYRKQKKQTKEPSSQKIISTHDSASSELTTSKILPTTEPISNVQQTVM